MGELTIHEGEVVWVDDALIREFSTPTWKALGLTVSRTPETPEGLWTLTGGRRTGVARLRSASGYSPQVRMLPKLASTDVFFLADNAWGHSRDLLEQSRLKANLDVIRQDPTACLLSWFLADLGSFVRRAIRHDYIRREEVLPAKIRGRMLLAPYVRQQLPRAQVHRVPCQFFDFTRDNLPNQILKATLRRVTQLIPEVRVPEARQALRAQVNSISPYLHAVTYRTIRDQDFTGLALRGSLRHYRPILEKCRAILGGAFLSTDLGPHVQSAFLWDMSLLFQEAIRGLLLRCTDTTLEQSRGRAELRKEDEVIAHSKVDPDYVVRTASSVAVLDAKYKDTNTEVVLKTEALDSGFGPSQAVSIPRPDVYQLIAYGRHDRHPTSKLALVYPVALTPGEPPPEPYRITGFAEEIKVFFVDIGAQGSDHAGVFVDQVKGMLD